MGYEVLAEQYRVIGIDSFVLIVLICASMLCLCISAMVIVDGDTVKAVSMLLLSVALLTMAAYININYKTHIIILNKSDMKYAELEQYEYLYDEGVLVAMTKHGVYKQKERARRRRDDEMEVEENSEVYSSQRLQ